MLGYLPLVSTVVVAIFTYQVLTRWWAHRGRLHLLFWGIGLIFYGIGSLTESLYALFGWQPGWGAWNFRFWYLAGAVLVAAWLGQGTVFLLWKRWAKPTLVLLILGSLYATYAVFTAPLDPTPLLGHAAELTAKGVLPKSVRLLTPFFNLYGTFTLVGGALWSSFLYWRKRVLFYRMVGNVLIAAGALSPAVGGALNRFGIPGLYLGELLGAVLMFWGFLLASRREEATTPAAAPAGGGR